MSNELVGWDDGKIYFYDRNGTEFCVNDHPDLLQKMVEICAGYFMRGED
ncbi:MAG: hypothetical protein AABY87_03560 [bacterium]